MTFLRPARRCCLAFLACAATLNLWTPKGAAEEGATVATVDGQAITREAFIQRLLADAGQSLLEKMIQELVVAQAAKQAGVEVGEQEITEQIAQVKATLPPGQTLQGMLADQGISMVTLRAQIRMRLRLKALVADQIDLSDAALRSYYETHPSLFVQTERVRVSHIWHRNEQKLRLLQLKVQRGVPFEELAEQVQKEANERAAKAALNGRAETVDQGGGVVGWIARDSANIEAPFLELAFRLKPGEVGGPVKTPQGYHLIKVLERTERRKPTFDEIKEKVRQTVEAEEMQRLMGERMAALLQKATIKRMLVPSPEVP